MKKLFTIITLLTIGLLTAQSTNQGMTENFNVSMGAAASSSQVSTHGSTVRFVNPARRIEGSVHLFEKWENTAIIYTSDNQRFLLRNINLNLKRNTFESKVSKDSLFTFNFNNIEKFVINNKTYKNYYWDEDNKVYQIIYENQNFQILKGFKLILIEGSVNPMINRINDRYIKKEYYFLRQDDRIENFKLKRKGILKLVDDEERVKNIQEYVGRNDLSFKKENDIVKILQYSYKN